MGLPRTSLVVAAVLAATTAVLVGVALVGGSAPVATPEQIALYSPERQIGPDLPPVFLLHAADDKAVPVENSLMMFSALKARAIPTEMHIFEEGGHGFGLRFVTGKPVAAWPGLFETFAKRHGL